MNVPYLRGNPQAPKEGKWLCAKKARANGEGETTLARGPRFCSGPHHVLLQVVVGSHLFSGYGGSRKCALPVSEAT
jgi:hypothetical protein